MALSEFGIQHALIGFAAACDIAGIKVSTSKTELLHLSENFVRCSLQVGEVSLKQVPKFECLGIVFMRNMEEVKTKN